MEEHLVTTKEPAKEQSAAAPSNDPAILRARLEASITDATKLRQRAQKAEARAGELERQLEEARTHTAFLEAKATHPALTDADMAACTETDPDRIKAWADAAQAILDRHAGDAPSATAPRRPVLDVRATLGRVNHARKSR